MERASPPAFVVGDGAWQCCGDCQTARGADRSKQLRHFGLVLGKSGQSRYRSLGLHHAQSGGPFHKWSAFRHLPAYGLLWLVHRDAHRNVLYAATVHSTDSLQHFAVFQQAANFYYVGVEDTVETESDLDYNDMVVTLGVATSAAHYSGLNTIAQGTWTGAFGADGSLIANVTSSLPAYATVSVTGDTPYTWAASTSDVRALQTASGSSSRIASTYYSPTTFTVDVNLTDGNTHQVALYLVDWDSTVRTESISIGRRHRRRPRQRDVCELSQRRICDLERRRARADSGDEDRGRERCCERPLL